MKSMLEVKKLKKRFGKQLVLDEITFSVQQKDIVALIGLNGCGKTTLLKSIARLCPYDAGDIIYENDKLRLGIVFQDFNLWPHKSVLDNIIEAPLLVHKLSKNEAIGQAWALLRTVGLEHKTHNYPFQLSGGEIQRVAIARCLAMKPDMLLLDEITSNLDPERIGEINTLIKNLAQKGHTIVFTSHDINFVKEVSDKVIFIDRGKIVEESTPKKMFSKPKDKRTKEFLSRVLQGKNP